MSNTSKNNNTVSSSAIWGGRFEKKPSEIMEKINASIDIDVRLWREDIQGSIAHAEMLGQCNILQKEDVKQIIDGLKQIQEEFEKGDFIPKTEFEDIHMNIEVRLKEIIGETAGKLHTARSRNDQVSTAFRLWIRNAIDILIEQTETLQDVLDNLADQHKDTIMPGFTHLQPAQPITLAMHLEAYGFMLSRDITRFKDCRDRLNKCPLGSAALAGTPFPIDRNITAQALGFDRPTHSTMDGVSARDFACEFLYACAQTGTHLSRLAEEIIIWSTPQFGFIKLSDDWSTGSSIMPQKKNPDAAELIRGKTGRLNGNLLALLTVMKAQPLTYNKDLQEDKEPVFDSFDSLSLCLSAMSGMLASADFQQKALRKATEDGFICATALADWLVMHLDMPFRKAHSVTGQIVKIAEQQECKLEELSLEDMQSIEKNITEDIFSVLSVENALKRKNA